MSVHRPDPHVELPLGLDAMDPLLQHRSRLGTMVLLTNADAMSFTRLRELLKETDGNLGAQLRKLEEAGYIAVKKQFAERKPVSWYSLTGAGRKAIRRHLNALRAVWKSASEESL
jgi:DNA-binding MarR family transcriptional regulator